MRKPVSKKNPKCPKVCLATAEAETFALKREKVQLCFNTSEFRSYVPELKALCNWTFCGSGDAPKTNQLFLGLTFHQISPKYVCKFFKISCKHTHKGELFSSQYTIGKPNISIYFVFLFKFCEMLGLSVFICHRRSAVPCEYRKRRGNVSLRFVQAHIFCLKLGTHHTI